MKRQIPPDLKGTFPLSFCLALFLFGMQCALAVGLALQGVFWWAKFRGFDPRYLGLMLACLLFNGFAMTRAVKVRHFLGLFSEWPGLPEEGSGETETRLAAQAARQAYFHGDYGKVPPLLERLGPPSAKISLARGRALAMAGRFDEALASLQAGGQGASAQRYLVPRRFLGLPASAYFSPQDISWAVQRTRLFLLGFFALGASTLLLALQAQDLGPLLTRQAIAEFSEKDFEVSRQGRFTLYYHDQKFMQTTADMADEALSKSLFFLGLPETTFAPGQIHLYLCANQAEYLARSPYTRSWEAGSAFPAKDQIYVYPGNDAIYYEIVVAHELTHLCYHRVVPEGHEDSWLNEGFANYMGYKFGLERAHMPVQAYLNEKQFKGLKMRALPFEEFLSENPRDMKDHARIGLFYTQGFSIVDVLIEQYGQGPFLRFLHFFGAGKSLEQALTAAYPTIRNSVELGAVWDLFMR